MSIILGIYFTNYLYWNVPVQGTNEDNALLLSKLLNDGRIYLVPGMVKGKYYLRYAICAASTAKKDIEYSWNVILEVAAPIIHSRS